MTAIAGKSRERDSLLGVELQGGTSEMCGEKSRDFLISLTPYFRAAYSCVRSCHPKPVGVAAEFVELSSPALRLDLFDGDGGSLADILIRIANGGD